MPPWRSPEWPPPWRRGCTTWLPWAEATLPPRYITRKSLTVTGVARYLPEYLHKSLVFLDKFQHKYPFDNFSSMTFDLNDLEKGLEMVANRKVIRAVVESGDESNARAIRRNCNYGTF